MLNCPAFSGVALCVVTSAPTCVSVSGAGVPSVYVVGFGSGYTNQVSFSTPAQGLVVAFEFAWQWCTIAGESVNGPLAVARAMFVLRSSEIASVTSFHILKFPGTLYRKD